MLLFGYDLLFLIVVFILIVIGIMVLAFIVGSLIHWLPAVIVAVIVWFFTGSLLYAALAFVGIAVLMIAFSRR